MKPIRTGPCLSFFLLKIALLGSPALSQNVLVAEGMITPTDATEASEIVAVQMRTATEVPGTPFVSLDPPRLDLSSQASSSDTLREEPFSQSLGKLDAGAWLVYGYRSESGSKPPFEVFSGPATIHVTAGEVHPERLHPVAGEPMVLSVVGSGDNSCTPRIDSVSIEGEPHRVVIHAQRPVCKPVPKRGTRFKVDVPVAPLAAGRYRVEVQVPKLGEEGVEVYAAASFRVVPLGEPRILQLKVEHNPERDAHSLVAVVETPNIASAGGCSSWNVSARNAWAHGRDLYALFDLEPTVGACGDAVNTTHRFPLPHLETGFYRILAHRRQAAGISEFWAQSKTLTKVKKLGQIDARNRVTDKRRDHRGRTGRGVSVAALHRAQGEEASQPHRQKMQEDRCPAGVLDEERAYFGSILETNTCGSPGEVCEDILFFSEQRHATAVCGSGRWLLREDTSAAEDSCPQFVFADGQIWHHGSFVPNACEAASALRCDRTYFYRLPEGGAGYRTAACVDGQWRPAEEEEPGDDEPFRLRRVRSESEFAAYLKQGLIATYGGESSFLYGPGGGGGVISPPDSSGLPLSQTNVQEAGVDEEDRIKSDGHHLFILNNHQSLRQPPPSLVGRDRIRILEIDAGQPSATPLSELELVLGEHQRALGIYLRAEASQLIVTASSLDLGWVYWYSPLAWLEAKSTVASVDVSDPVNPEQAATLELEGDIISSRRIGDIVYLATRFQPYIQGLEPFYPNSPESVAAIERIEAAQLDDLVPSYRSTASPEWQPLVRPSDCYLPTEEAPVVAADLISLVAIDLDTMEVASSNCFVGATETLYVSPVSIYLASSRYEYSLVAGDDGVPWTNYTQPQVETDLHKFSLSSGLISYEASGLVDGHLGWNILRKPFRLSESGDDLRVITYTDELTEDQSPVAVTVLRDTGDDELEVLSRLPNQQRPDPIGKPGEQLYATRFVGDRAYLVTFLATDPLYVIDLSRPEDPFVAGELEITGFSDYLHPIDGDYVLGVGKDAIPDPGGDFRGAWHQGLKVSLYDVSDPNNPFEADAVIIGKRGSEAPVLHDHRAFTFLQGEGENPRLAIGAVVHERITPGTTVYPWTFFGWSYSGLHLFEVDTAAGKILRRGEMRVEEYQPTPSGEWPLIYDGEDRSVLAGEAIFYVHGDDVYTSLWSNPGLFEGPK